MNLCRVSSQENQWYWNQQLFPGDNSVCVQHRDVGQLGGDTGLGKGFVNLCVLRRKNLFVLMITGREGSIMAGNCGSKPQLWQQEQLRTHVLNWQAGMKKSQFEIVPVFKLSKPTPSDILPPIRRRLLNLPNRTINLGPNVQMPKTSAVGWRVSFKPQVYGP